ncbi:MAG: zinc-finger domain-containing protein [Alphaproteobacteria bacterium]
MNRISAMNDAKAGETIDVTTTTPTCDGGGAALGHPRVTLHIEPASGVAVCPYCSRRYALKPGQRVAAHS